ncbi:MAG: radical SAM protein [Candidatus Jordarchaeaceae archaeon]
MSGLLSELFVEVTDRCLLNCQHCSTEAWPGGKQEIPFFNLLKLIDEGIHLGLRAFSVSGGEPFLYPEIMPLIRYAKKKKLFLSLYTCGIILNGKKISSLPNNIIEELFDQKVDRLIFSIHGLEPTHDKITALPGSFQFTLTSIKNALASGIHVELHFVPMKNNIQDIPGIIELANNLGVRHISFLRLVPQGRCMKRLDLLPDREQLENVVRWRYVYGKIYPHIHIRMGAPFNCIHPTVPCTAGENKLLISSTGEVFPCEAFKFLRGSRRTIYGSNLIDLWNNDALLEKLRFLKREGSLKGCSDCSRFAVCKGGCPGQRMLFRGDIACGPDPLCQTRPGGYRYERGDKRYCRTEKKGESVLCLP